MQKYIYNYLFKRTLQDLDELMNIAPDDGRKDHLWDARVQLLKAREGSTQCTAYSPEGRCVLEKGHLRTRSSEHLTQCETIDAQGLRCCLPAAHLHGHKNADEVWGGGAKKEVLQ